MEVLIVRVAPGKSVELLVLVVPKVRVAHGKFVELLLFVVLIGLIV